MDKTFSRATHLQEQAKGLVGSITLEEKLKGIDFSKLPKNVDVNADSITGIVHANHENCQDERMKFVMNSLISHLHNFVRETALTESEWMAAINFLTETGQACTDIRQEFILLSDTLGVSTLVDAMNNAKPPKATESTVLGPFFTDDAHTIQKGDSIASEGKGEYLYVEGLITDTQGRPIPNAVIDTWETDGHGLYDTQYESRNGPECRGRLRSAEDGSYAFRAVVPVPYPIPDDGPVGWLVPKLGRHVYRPAHLHLRIEAPGYETLTTSLYFKGDPFLTSDAVFGVKTSLIVETQKVDDPQLCQARGFVESKPHQYLYRDLVLATKLEGDAARAKLRAK